MKKSYNIPILIIVGVVLLIGALVYIFGFTPAKDIFTRGRADRALSLGNIEVTTENDIKNYFIFLPREEVKALLVESKDKFLFPQVDLLPASGRSLMVGEQTINIEGSPMSFVTISGLASGAKIYPTIGGFVRGGMFSDEDNSFAWTKEFWGEGDRGETILTYFSISPTQEIRDLTFNANIGSEVYSAVAYSSHLATLLTEDALPENLIPGGVNFAMAVAGQEDSSFNRLQLKNILTKNGRIVMIQK